MFYEAKLPVKPLRFTAPRRRRYTTPRNVSLCLPKHQGVSAAEKGYPLRVTWDQTNTVILHPGNCLYFDAKRVTVKPATDLPSGVTLQGRVETTRALQG